MDALQQARRAAANADVLSRPSDPAEEMEFAKLYATLAIAEQLERIAKELHTLNESYAAVEFGYYGKMAQDKEG